MTAKDMENPVSTGGDVTQNRVFMRIIGDSRYGKKPGFLDYAYLPLPLPG
jgi:hypothetical protein